MEVKRTQNRNYKQVIAGVFLVAAVTACNKDNSNDSQPTQPAQPSPPAQPPSAPDSGSSGSSESSSSRSFSCYNSGESTNRLSISADGDKITFNSGSGPMKYARSGNETENSVLYTSVDESDGSELLLETALITGAPSGEMILRWPPNGETTFVCDKVSEG